MSEIKKIHHVAVVVEDVERSLHFWRDVLGMETSLVKAVPEQKARIAFLPAGEGELELVQPVDADSGLARYLAKRGEGMHHICLQVMDIAGMLTRMKTNGIRLIDEQPVKGEAGKLYAFVHPEATGGVLLELYQLPD